MNRANSIKAIALAMLCLPFCGGWTAAPQAEAEQEKRFVGGELISACAEETVSYVTKYGTEDIYTACYTPRYYPISGLSNCCGPVAGAITVGFYDRFSPNLIPNWDSFQGIRYNGQDTTYVPALIQDLYTRMGTNTSGSGVTVSGFKTGLTNYASSKGYNVTYTSLGSGNSFNLTGFKTAITYNEVVVMFVDPSNFYIIVEEDNQDIISTYNMSRNHVVVAYGYYEVKYILNKGTRTDKYLYVATGLTFPATAYYKIGSYIDSAYRVKIG